jgi:hypothetical protein
LLVLLLLILWCVSYLMVVMCVLLMGNIDQGKCVLFCLMHSSFSFWKFQLFFLPLPISLRIFPIYYMLIVNSINFHIFCPILSIFYPFYPFLSIVSNYVGMSILSVTSQSSNHAFY